MSAAKNVYAAFRASMLAKTEDWKDLLAEDVTLTGPLAQVAGKQAFIDVNQPFFDSIVNSNLLMQINKNEFVITQISTSVNTPSGKIITLEVSEWYEIKNGLLQSLKVYFDTDEFRKELFGQ